MIERQVIDGRPATVATLEDGLTKIRFDDGEVVFLAPEKKPLVDIREIPGKMPKDSKEH